MATFTFWFNTKQLHSHSRNGKIEFNAFVHFQKDQNYNSHSQKGGPAKGQAARKEMQDSKAQRKEKRKHEPNSC